MSSKSGLPHLGRWGELGTWSLLPVPSRPPCGPVVCSSQPAWLGARTVLFPRPLSHQDEPRIVASRVLCGLPASVPHLPEALLLTGAAAAFLQAASGRRACACFLPADTALLPSCLPLGLCSGVRSRLLPWRPLQNVASSSVTPLTLLLSLSHYHLRDTQRICCLAATTKIEIFRRLVLPACFIHQCLPLWNRVCR